MKKTMESKTCANVNCLTPFKTSLRSKRYCDSCTPVERAKVNNKNLLNVSCSFCEILFTPTSKQAHLCSKNCRDGYWARENKKTQPIRPCRECGVDFMPRDMNANFCQAKCRQNFNRKKANERGRQPVNAEVSCVECGDSFVRLNSLNKSCPDCTEKRRIGGNKMRTVKCQLCHESFPCSGAGRYRYCSACREKYPTTIPQQSKKPCEQCGEPFTHMRKDARFCSFTCSSKWLNATGQGPRYDDSELLARIVTVINSHERCLSQEELLAEARVTHKVLLAREWTMEFLYTSAGRSYDAPVLNSRFEERVYSVLSDLVPGMVIEHDKTLPGMLGFKKGEQRADLFIQELNLLVEADGDQHLDGRGDLENLDYIQANDRLKNNYALSNGITLIRIPYTVDTRSIKAQLLRGIRRAHPRFRPLKPSNTSAPARRMPARRNTSNRPKIKRGEKGVPVSDIYCRGCHERPSYKHGKTYLCATCWERSGELWLTSRALQVDEILTLKDELDAFIKGRGRYVWHPEVYLHFRPVSAADLKRVGIKVATICRELGLFAPEDDRIGQETVQRVKDFVINHLNVHEKLPMLRKVLKEVGIDHTTLWTYMDYDQFVAGLGGRDRAIIRYRFRDAGEFLKAAADVVLKAGRSMRMREIVDAVGISYPTYLSNFKSVRSEDIHDKAGVPRFSRDSKKP